MNSAAYLTTQLIECIDRDRREQMYLYAQRLYGDGFADHLRDVIEAHHMIAESQRAALACRQREGTDQ